MRTAISARHRRRAATLATAAAVVGLGIVVPATSASAISSLPNVAQTVTVKSCGAEAVVKVYWEGATSVSLRWTVEDTKSDGKSPVLRMFASNPDETDPSYTFSGGASSYVLTEGFGGSASGGMDDWNPAGFGDILDLEIALTNGTASQGPACATTTVRAYNFGRIALRNALTQNGDEYQSGGNGPSEWDCSGLTSWAFNSINGFSGLPRTSSAQRSWAEDHGVVVAYGDKQPGDLLFWPGHVAFYYGNGQIFDAATEARGVSIHAIWGDPTVIRIRND